jgi:hypothetical protein
MGRRNVRNTNREHEAKKWEKRKEVQRSARNIELSRLPRSSMFQDNNELLSLDFCSEVRSENWFFCAAYFCHFIVAVCNGSGVTLAFFFLHCLSPLACSDSEHVSSGIRTHCQDSAGLRPRCPSVCCPVEIQTNHILQNTKVP